MNPRTAAIAYRIWAYANPRGWDCTVREIADELEESVHSVRGICTSKGWSHRLMATDIRKVGYERIRISFLTMTDDELGGHFS
jgi:hypothetical protein